LSWKIFSLVLISTILSPSPVIGQQGNLRVTPESGPIGTRVTLEGEACGQSPLILFGGTGLEGQGTAGSSTVPGIVTNEPGEFQVLYTIPAEIGPQQQWLGGPVVPGLYNFTTKPPACQTFFTVTSQLPSTGGTTAGEPNEWAVAIVSGLIFVVGIGSVAALWRRSKRLRQ
jgi:hypothetical protein